MTRRFGIAILMLLLWLPAASAIEIWYEDNNLGRSGGKPDDFVEKFKQPESWQQATKRINVYLMRAIVLNKMDDGFFVEHLGPYLKQNNIRLALNVGGATLARANERRERIIHGEMRLLNRLKGFGIPVHYISLQSVLSKGARTAEDRSKMEYPVETRIEDILTYAKEATSVYPAVQIGIIDARPVHGKTFKDEYRALRDAMKNAGTPLSYIHLDMSFDAAQTSRRGLGWPQLREIERYVEEDLGLAFGLFAKSRRGGMTSSASFHRRTLGTLSCYAGTGGTPREYIIASWFPHPEKTIPENATGDDYPAMRTVLEFGKLLDDTTSQAWLTSRPTEHGWKTRCGIRER